MSVSDLYRFRKRKGETKGSFTTLASKMLANSYKGLVLLDVSYI